MSGGLQDALPDQRRNQYEVDVANVNPVRIDGGRQLQDRSKGKKGRDLLFGDQRTDVRLHHRGRQRQVHLLEWAEHHRVAARQRYELRPNLRINRVRAAEVAME